jgi:DNA-binding response OmpR family regulator
MQEKTTQESATPRRLLVCVVEDDSALLASICFSLEVQGMDVRCFPTAAALTQDLALASPVDCFVIDQILPDLPGLELLKALRDAGHTAPALLITTNPKEALRVRAAAMGVAILEKPLLGNDLAVAIRAATSQAV